jgi:hypothetical protein
MVVNRQDAYRAVASPLLPFASPGPYAQSPLRLLQLASRLRQKTAYCLSQKRETVGLLLKLKKEERE